MNGERDVFDQKGTPDQGERLPALRQPSSVTLDGDAVSLVLTDDQWANLIMAKAKRQERIVEAFVSQLDPATDVAIVHGNPCFNKSAMRKLLSLAGGTFEFQKDGAGRPLFNREDREDAKGKYYIYIGYATYTTPTGRSITASASASSREPFFSIEGGRMKAQEEINEDHIRSMCQSNLLKVCLFTALGFSTFTLERLKRLGMNVDLIPGYRGKGYSGGSRNEYQKRTPPPPPPPTKAPTAPAPTSVAADPNTPVSKETLGTLQLLFTQRLGGKKKEIITFLGAKGMLSDPDQTYKDLSEKNAQIIISNIDGFVAAVNSIGSEEQPPEDEK